MGWAGKLSIAACYRRDAAAWVVTDSYRGMPWFAVGKR